MVLQNRPNNGRLVAPGPLPGVLSSASTMGDTEPCQLDGATSCPTFLDMRMDIVAGVVGVLVFGGIGRQGWATTSPQPRAWAGADVAFDRAWRDVALGAKRSARAGDWVVEKTQDGAITAYQTAHKAGAAAERAVDDAAILTKIKARLLADPSTSSRAINVDVDKGIVTMTGQVQGDEEAKTAVRLAQQTAGVTRVVSRLRWPGMVMAPAAR